MTRITITVIVVSSQTHADLASVFMAFGVEMISKVFAERSEHFPDMGLMSMLETYGILPGETFNGLQNGPGRDIKSCLTFIRRPIPHPNPTDGEMKFNICQVPTLEGLMPHLCRAPLHPNDGARKKKQITASWHGALISPAGKRASGGGQEGVVLKGRKDTRQTQFRACFTGQRPRPTRPTRGANAATLHYPSSFRDFFPDFSDRGCTLLGYFDNQICANKRVA